MAAETPTQKTIEQLTEEFIQRLRRGERPSISEYVSNNAVLADEIREVFPALAMLERLGSPPGDSEQLRASASALEQLGDYRIVREVGRGGMGVVYEAIQEPLGRQVALKVLPLHFADDPVCLERFQREARVAARLHHTNIVPVFDVGECDRVHFYTMQFIQGQGLDQVIKELIRLRKEPLAVLPGECNGPSSRRAAVSHHVAQSLLSGRFEPFAGEAAAEVADRTDRKFDCLVTRNSKLTEMPVGRAEDPNTADAPSRQRSSVRLPGHAALSDSSTAGQPYYRSVARVGLQVAEALAYVHSQGLLHRDIKPSNLLLDTHGVVWITDLGLARDDESAALTRTGDVVGTVRYMAPERFRGESRATSDVYGLGMTLYELLAFRSPFDESDRSRLIYEITSKDPAPPRTHDPRVPRDLETIILKAIDREPARRYQSAEELAADLRSFLDDRPIRARRSGVLERGWRWCRRNRLVASLAASIVALLLAAAIAGSIAALVFRDQANDLRQEQATSTQRLYDALFARAESGRWSGRMGQRFDSLEALTEAVRLGPVLHWNDAERLRLRNEVIACLILPDLRLAQPIHGLAPGRISLSHDGKLERYVASDPDGDLHLFRTADHVEIARLPGPGDRAHVAQFSGDGRLLAAKYHGRQPPVARVWDLANRKVLLESPGGEFDFSPDDKRLALVKPDGAIEIFDLQARQVLKRLRTNPPCDLVRFHPSEQLLALCNRGRNDVRILDIESEKVIKTFQHPQSVFSLNWDSTGRFLACACFDHRVYVWDVGSGEKQAVLTGHQAEVVGVLFSHTGSTVASWSWDQTTRLWDYRTGRQLMTTGGEPRTFSADDRHVATRNPSGYDSDDVRVYDFESGDECRTLQEVGAKEKSPTHLDISPDNRLILSTGPEGIRLWDLATAEQLAALYTDGETVDVAPTAFFHPSGNSLFTSTRQGIFRWPIKRTPQKRGDRMSIGPPQRLSQFTAPEWACLNQSGNDLGVIYGQDAYVIPLDRPAKPVRLAGHDNVKRIAVSPDGKWAATGTWHGRGVVLWNAKTGQRVRDLFPEADSATVAFTPDGQWLVTGANNIYRLWQVGEWNHRDIPGTFPYAISVSNDNEIMAVNHSPTKVRLVKPSTGQMLAELEAQNPQLIDWLRLTGDGSRLAVACSTHTIQLWDLRRIRRQLATLGLDWDAPPSPPDDSHANVPVQVEVDQGQLAPSRAGS